MFRGDVPDFVPEYFGELRLGIEVSEQAAGDENESARRGEGVYRRIVDDVELPGQVR